MIKKFCYIVFFIFFIFPFLYAYSYPKNRLKVATIDLDNTLKKETSIRDSIITTINRSPYLKQVIARKVDGEKHKLFSTNNISIDEAITIARELKVDVAIIMYSEERLKTNSSATNNVTNGQITNNSITNDMEDVLFPDGGGMIIEDVGKDNAGDTNITLEDIDIMENKLKTDNITNDNAKNSDTEEEKDAEEEKDEYDTFYIFKTIEVATENVLKEKEAKSKNEVSSVISEIASSLEIYFSKEIFKGIEKRTNDIDFKFWIDVISLEDETNSVTNVGNIIEGESISLNFSVNKRGYVNIFAFQSDDIVIMMFPNDFSSEDGINETQIYSVPPTSAMFKIVSRAPFGVDSFFAIYTEKKLDWISKSYFSGDGFRQGVKNTIAIFSRIMRNKLKNMKDSSWQIKKIYLESSQNENP